MLSMLSSLFSLTTHVFNLSFLYVMAAGDTSITVTSLDAPGKATPVQQFNFADEAKKNGVTIGAFHFPHTPDNYLH